MNNPIRFIAIMLALAVLGCNFGQRSVGRQAPATASSNLSAEALAAFDAAAAYSEQHSGVSMLVWRDGEIIYERYPAGSSADDAHILHSGTKSFSCAIAVSAAADGLLTFDERVAETITEWSDDPQKSQITIRQLISLSSGLSGGTVGETPTYTEALGFRMLGDPGTVFDYGPVPYQVFGELMQRKLNGESPLDYLKRKVFDPIGLTYADWEHTADGEPHLPNGAYLTAQEWVKYGILILNQGEWNGQQVLDQSLLSECFVGSEANPGYGMTWWLPMAEGADTSADEVNNGTTGNMSESTAPPDLIQASGARGQRLFIIPSLNVVIVRQADSRGQGAETFSNAEFLRLMRGAR